MKEKVESMDGFSKIKRNIYLIIIPLLIMTNLFILLFYPKLDHIYILIISVIILFLMFAGVCVYYNWWFRQLEILALCIFSIYHLLGVLRLEDAAVHDQLDLYTYWAPLFYLFVFLILKKHIALIFSILIVMISIIIGIPIMLNGSVQEHGLFQFWLSQFIYIAVFYMFQIIVGGYLKSEMLKKFAFEDTLTGLDNRRALETLLEHEIEHHQVNPSPFSLIFFDIDHFKAINDNWGHEIGDEVLKELSRIVKSQLPNNCEFGRWGGEEFIILYKDNSVETATVLAESIRKAIEQHTFQKVGRVTASMGVSTFKKGDHPRTLVMKADLALYEAKSKGRNTVEVHLG